MNDILITGGSGYFAHGLVKFLLERATPERICIFSRNEWAQAQMRTKFNDSPRLRWFIGDVRDQGRLRRAMAGVDIVIHAAALKRVQAAAYNVLEAVATNVIGTRNVVDAAIDAGVGKAILLSSDKACHPTTTYGVTKALAEHIFLQSSHYAGKRGPKFAVCRYGNVWNSTGSVLPTWRGLLAAGVTELPVSDPECSRFFMTLDEAVRMVWETASTMEGGELVTPDLPAYRLGDLVTAIGAKPRVIGMDHCEKLHEEMRPGETSENARRLSVGYLRAQIAAAA